MSSSKRVTANPASNQATNDRPGISVTGLSRRSALALGTAGLGSLLLSACGFHPMYGDPSSGSAGGATSNKLALIKIDPIADRMGQQMHNRLRDRMNPAGQPDKPNYRLGVTMTEDVYATANGDTHVRHQTMTVVATYWLSPADNDKSYLMNRVNSRVQVSYDTFDDPYNDLATKQDAELRAVDQLADMITTRVAAYFAHNAA